MKSGRTRLITISLLAALAAIAASAWLLVRAPPEPAPALRPSDPGASTPLVTGAGGDTRKLPPDPESTRPQGGHAGSATASSGWRIGGRVLARGGRPVGGARVGIAIERGGDVHEIAAVETDADGRYTAGVAAIEAIEALQRGSATLEAAVHAPQFQPLVQRRTLAQAMIAAGPSQLIPIDFHLEAGSRLSGRAVDGAGKPVSAATVAVWVQGVTATGRPARTKSAETLSGADGRFDLGFVSGGTYQLGLRAEGCGTHFEDALELEAGADRNLGDLVLKGEGSLAGVARYPDRGPATSLELWATSSDNAGDPNALAHAVIQAPEVERGDGLSFARTTTDATGRFEFKGLRPGFYGIRAPKPDIVIEPHQARFPAGQADIALQVESFRLIVRARDAAGRPVPGATVSCAHMTQLEDGRLEPAGVTHGAALGPDASVSFEVEPEVTLGISARVSGGPKTEDLVILAQGQYELVREIVLQPPGASGRLRLILAGEGGAAGANLSNARVSLLSALTELRDDDLGVLLPDVNGLLPALPPGKYLIEAGFGDERDGPSFVFPIKTRDTVEIRDGQTSELTLTARAGARLKLNLDIRGSRPPGFDLVIPPGASQAEAERLASLQLSQHGALVKITPAGGGKARAMQFLSPPDPRTQRAGIDSVLLPGTSALAEDLLEPGRYTINVEALGFQIASADVSLQVGRINDVRVTLFSK